MFKLSRVFKSLQTQAYIHQSFSRRSKYLSTLWCTKCRDNRSIAPATCFCSSAKYHQGGEGGGSLREMDTGQSGGHTGVPDYYPVVPVIPIPRSPIYPKFLKLIEVTDKSLMGVLRRQWQRAQPYAGVFLRKDELSKEIIYDLDEIHQIGTFVKISQLSGSPEKLQLTLEGHRRIKIISVAGLEQEEGPIERFLSRDDGEEAEEEDNVDGNEVTAGPEAILMANVENYDDFPYEQTEELKSTSEEVIKTVRKIVGKNQHFNDVLQQIESLRPYVVPNHLADFGAALTVMSFATSSEPLQLQSVLEERDIPKRLEKSLELLKRELDLINLQQRYGAEAEEKVNVNQRRFMLEQQMKLIEKELGVENDSKDAESNKFRERLKLLSVPEKVNGVIEEEISKLSYLDQHSSEFNITRTYLDWLTSIPWGVNSKEVFEISRAMEILEEDHYGLDDIKERILEFIAVGQLSGSVQGKILCFWGPPGVGKTSIGKSIARALNREYFRFSVGGMTDVAEIKGHRRTYIGAMPGKIVQCLKKTKTENPLILIDEVDKIGHGGIKGDPSAALLELLDPEQNTNFLDHYLDVSVDLSRVLFICTANSLETIPVPLRDRMEMIQVSGYVDEEKLGIAEKYLIPVAMKSSGVTVEMVRATTDAVRVLIEQYCRESGVRNLQKHIEKLFRKSALRYVKGKSSLVVTPENLHEFVGNSKFNSEMMYENSPAGVTIGLAWTSMGGTTLFIETVLDEQADRKTPSLEMTGQLGDVMKESIQIAYTFAKAYLLKHMPSNDFFKTASIHLHIPEGATPKDGPSAGSTIITALLSLALNQPIRCKLAMTGEVSLTGKILPVGGIKEKILAARRSGIKTVLLPYGNRKDYEELPTFLKADIDVVFIRDYGDIFAIVFEGQSV